MGKLEGACIDTKMRVVAALQHMMEKQKLEKIKVKDLCKMTGISRTTFYEYFHDVFEVPTWLWDYLMSQSLYEIGKTQGFLEGHKKKFDLLLEHKEFFMLAFRSDDYNSVFEYGQRMVKDNMVKNALNNAGRPFTDHEYLEIEFYNAGASYMTKVWARNGMKESGEEMSELFTSFAPKVYRDHLVA